MGNGEIARYEQFLLFPQCFHKTCTAVTYNPGFVWVRNKCHSVTHDTQQVMTLLWVQENTVDLLSS